MLSKVTIIEWSDLILGGNGDYLTIELERIEELLMEFLDKLIKNMYAMELLLLLGQIKKL